MKDRRPGPWVALPTRWCQDPSYLSLSPLAREALVRLWLYCGEQRLSGSIPKSTVLSLGITEDSINELVSEKHCAFEISENGKHSVKLCAFLDWNRSAEQIAEVIEIKKRAGKHGGRPKKSTVPSTAALQESGFRNQETRKIPTESSAHAEGRSPEQTSFVPKDLLKSPKTVHEAVLPFPPWKIVEIMMARASTYFPTEVQPRDLSKSDYVHLTGLIKKYPTLQEWEILADFIEAHGIEGLRPPVSPGWLSSRQCPLAMASARDWHKNGRFDWAEYRTRTRIDANGYHKPRLSSK